MALKQRGPSGQGWRLAPGPQPHLHVTPIQVHPADHAALGCHVRPVDHLLSVVEVQGNGTTLRVPDPLNQKLWTQSQ